jgi:D-3-phosphoglycerate dehydrogenase
MGQLGLAGRPKPQRSDRLYELGRAQDAADEIGVNVRPQAAVVPACGALNGLVANATARLRAMKQTLLRLKMVLGTSRGNIFPAQKGRRSETMALKVLVADKLSRLALDIFARRGIDAHVKTDLSRDELIEIIPNYDGLAVRSSKVTEKIIAAADRLKVIGRAGIGVDNVDVRAATARGIIVMNTPFASAITTAEHAIALMLALARQVPLADVTTRAGKWAKSQLIGVEITGKCLGIIGCGNIGSIVADRARGLKMKVVAFDPFLSPEQATDLGVEKVELDALFQRAHFVTLHTPLTDKTRRIINSDTIRLMRDGVRIINCARGGLIDERALFDALQAGKVAGAAIDVYEVEPATDNILFTSDNVICTPHLGASTREAQENVAIQNRRADL